MTIIKGARIGEHREKTIVCDHCGRHEAFGPVATKQASWLAWRNGWVRVVNDGDNWNLCPECGNVPALSTFSQPENHL